MLLPYSQSLVRQEAFGHVGCPRFVHSTVFDVQRSTTGKRPPGARAY